MNKDEKSFDLAPQGFTLPITVSYEETTHE